MKIISIRNASDIKIGGVRIHIPHDTLIEVSAGVCYDLFIKEVDLPELNRSEQNMAYENKIMAIKDYRDRTGLGLRESKMAVDLFLEQNPKKQS